MNEIAAFIAEESALLGKPVKKAEEQTSLVRTLYNDLAKGIAEDYATIGIGLSNQQNKAIDVEYQLREALALELEALEKESAEKKIEIEAKSDEKIIDLKKKIAEKSKDFFAKDIEIREKAADKIVELEQKIDKTREDRVVKITELEQDKTKKNYCS